MLTDSVTDEDNESASFPAAVTDESCRMHYIEIVPLTADTDGPCTTECDWSAEVKQEHSPAVKQEPVDGLVRSTIILCSRDWSAAFEQETLPVVKQEPHDVCKH